MIGSNQAELMDSPADIYENAWQAIYNSARYGSNQNYTTNVQNPNMTHEEAALLRQPAPVQLHRKHNEV